MIRNIAYRISLEDLTLKRKIRDRFRKNDNRTHSSTIHSCTWPYVLNPINAFSNQLDWSINIFYKLSKITKPWLRLVSFRSWRLQLSKWWRHYCFERSRYYLRYCRFRWSCLSFEPAPLWLAEWLVGWLVEPELGSLGSEHRLPPRN